MPDSEKSVSHFSCFGQKQWDKRLEKSKLSNVKIKPQIKIYDPSEWCYENIGSNEFIVFAKNGLQSRLAIDSVDPPYLRPAVNSQLSYRRIYS